MDRQSPYRKEGGKPKIALITRILRRYRFPIYYNIANEFDISIFVLEKSPQDSEWIANKEGLVNIHVRYIDSIRVGRFCSEVLNIPSAPLGMKAVLASVCGDWDCIVVDGFETGAPFLYSVLNKFKNVPFVLVCATTIECESQTHVPFLRVLKGMAIKQADVCLCYGTEARRFVMSFGKHLRNVFAPCFSYSRPPNIEKAFAHRGSKDMRSQFGLRKDSPVLLYLGQFLKRKNLLRLMESFARARKSVPDAQFLIVGKGPEKSHLKRFAHKLGICDAIKFYPPMEWDNVWQVYAVADVFALVSTKDSWGLVINEAMLAGLPVISSTGCGASFDLVHHGVTGFVVKPHQIDAMANYLTLLLSRERLRREFGQNAIRVISRWTLQEQIESFALAVREALKRRARC